MSTSAVLAIVLCASGCVFDLRTRRIPNALTFGGAVGGVIFHLWTAGVAGALWSVGGFGTGLVLFMPVYLLGGLGAGDVKLLAAVGAWLGPAVTGWAALYGAVAGGVMGVGLALARGYLRTAVSNVWAVVAVWRVSGVRPVEGMTLDGSPRASPRLAYALPIAVGTMVAVWLHSR